MVPYLEVFDMPTSKAFYCDVLGFTVVYASPEVTTREGTFSHFMRLRFRDDDLFLNTAYDADERPADRSEARWAGCEHVALYIDVEDADAFHAELTKRGATVSSPTDTDYGYRAVTVHDPDGHRLVFHTPLPGTPEARRRAESQQS